MEDRRSSESAAVRRLVDRARRGQGGALVVRGTTGVGKSAVLTEAVSAAVGMTVLKARGVATETGIAYSALYDVLRPITGFIERLPSVQARVVRGALAMGAARPGDRLTIGVAVLGLLLAAARERPVLVVLDNVELLDAPSAEALAFAARRAEGEPVAVLASVREPDGAGGRFRDFETLQLDAASSSVDLLGGFRASVEGRPVTLPGLTRQLVALVALSGPVTTEAVVETLWPGVLPDQGQRRLRKILWRVRQAGAGDLIVRRGDALALAPGVVVDATRFSTTADAALARGSLTDREALALARLATGLYSGDLLPAARYLEWTVAPREGLRRRFVALLDLLAGDAADRGDPDEAVALLDRAIEHDPYDEERYLRAATLLLAQERRGPALVLLQRAEQMMEELGLPSSAPLEQLRRELRSE